MEWDLKEFINLGVPMVILASVGWALWRFGWYCVYKVFGSEAKGTRGLAGDWVAGEVEWRSKLTDQLATQTERLQQQGEACTQHVVTLKALSEAFSENAAFVKDIDDILEKRTEMLTDTHQGVKDLKQCVFHWCDICQALVAKEFPGSVGEISAYLMAIKKRVNDAAQ